MDPETGRDVPEDDWPEPLDWAPDDTAEPPTPVRDAVDRVRAAVRRFDEDHRSTSFVSGAETVHIDERRHPFLLVAPVVRTLVALLLIAVGVGPLLALTLVVVVVVWVYLRFRVGVKRTALISGGSVVALVLLEAVIGPVLCVVLVLGWLTEDLVDWCADRLVVTDRRIYRRHGVLTRHSPSIALTAIAYIDSSVTPLGSLLHYGTLRLDSVAQRDDPLSRFDLIPDVVAVTHEILRLRTQAMPRFQQPY